MHTKREVERSTVERAIGYLKEFFQLNNVSYHTGERAKVHFDMVTLVYNVLILTRVRLNRKKPSLET